MDNSMQVLDKVMTKATEMMENMVEVSRLNLEKEKVKLRRLEIKRKLREDPWIARTKGGSVGRRL
ncbi:uncharacterized protein LOC112468461 isoform X4 [Temnothorax curvispinosus]|uniref:Uncharacterized protein LOC112468461 isoform X4 n=1 Tax=Temnothorax curvispinosus TaxID=300111 RepID=A0A6J1RL84_9HYME|nr:uncharacterized protein LOC112468461 isoform X4 [Temnothorax curvispinosus]